MPFPQQAPAACASKKTSFSGPLPCGASSLPRDHIPAESWSFSLCPRPSGSGKKTSLRRKNLCQMDSYDPMVFRCRIDPLDPADHLCPMDLPFHTTHPGHPDQMTHPGHPGNMTHPGSMTHSCPLQHPGARKNPHPGNRPPAFRCRPRLRPSKRAIPSSLSMDPVTPSGSSCRPLPISSPDPCRSLRHFPDPCCPVHLRHRILQNGLPEFGCVLSSHRFHLLPDSCPGNAVPSLWTDLLSRNCARLPQKKARGLKVRQINREVRICFHVHVPARLRFPGCGIPPHQNQTDPQNSGCLPFSQTAAACPVPSFRPRNLLLRRLPLSHGSFFLRLPLRILPPDPSPCAPVLQAQGQGPLPSQTRLSAQVFHIPSSAQARRMHPRIPYHWQDPPRRKKECPPQGPGQTRPLPPASPLPQPQGHFSPPQAAWLLSPPQRLPAPRQASGLPSPPHAASPASCVPPPAAYQNESLRSCF